METDALRVQREGGITSDNSSFAQYEGVTKPSYNLTEAGDAAEDAFDDGYQLQTVDISALLAKPEDAATLKEVASQLGPALEKIGFAIVTGHGVAEALISEAHARIEPFFRETGEESKRRFAASRHGSVNQGYFAIEQTSNLHPDQVEGWVFCRRAFGFESPQARLEAAKEFWPDEESHRFFSGLVEQKLAIVKPLMRCMLHHLGADPHSFDKRLTGNNFGLRLNYYPPLDETQLARGCGRMLAHEDVDLFTLLPASAVEGLQVLNRENMKWIRVKAPPGSIILNVGDYLQRITNDRLPSTTHRVAPPRSQEQRSKPRTSVPLAVYLDEDEVLECLPECGQAKYPPISAIDFHTGITSKYYGDGYRQTGSDK